MFKKICVIAGVIGVFTLFSAQALAGTNFGPCTPQGGTHVFNMSTNRTVTDVENNVTGATFVNFDSWSLNSYYAMSCQCPDNAIDSEAPEEFFKAVVPLAYQTSAGGREYYRVDDNIAVASEVLISGGLNQYVKTPFENIGNNTYSLSVCEQNPQSTQAVWGSGGKGNLSLYIVHPFVGVHTIPNTKIIDLYVTKERNVYGSVPASSVFISGTFTVPQGCELSSGSTLEIPFGEFKASDFKDRKGQIAKNATKFGKELEFKCTNISDGVKIFLRIEGMPNANDSNAIDMGNPDIGAVIEGANGNILVPNDSSANQELSVSALVDGEHRTATTSISAYPISTTGKLPAAGNFEGIATMRIDVE